MKISLPSYSYSARKKSLECHRDDRRIDGLHTVRNLHTLVAEHAHVCPCGLRQHHECLIFRRAPCCAPGQYGNPCEPIVVMLRCELDLKQQTFLRHIFFKRDVSNVVVIHGCDKSLTDTCG